MTLRLLSMTLMWVALFCRADAAPPLPGDSRLNPVQIGGDVGDYDLSGRTDQLDLDLPLIHWGMSREDRPQEWVNELPVQVIDHFEVNRVLLNWDNRSGSPLETLPRVGVEEIEIDTEYLDDVLPGYITNDLRISFQGQYTGSQLQLELTRGTIYQEPVVGGVAAPISEAIFEFVPEVEFDTFVTNGHLTYTQSPIYGIGGGAVNLRGDVVRSFNASSLNVMWFPAGDMAVFDRSDFLVARVTMSPDAMGSYSYVAFSNGLPTYVRGRVHLGVMERAIPFPEPTSLAISLLLVACATFCAKSRSECFAGRAGGRKRAS